MLKNHVSHLKSLFLYVIGLRETYYVPLDVLNMRIFHLGLPGSNCTQEESTDDEVGGLPWLTSCAVLSL